MLRPENCLRRSEDVLTQQAADAMILLSLHSGQYYELNEVGHSVWDLCDGTKRIDEIISIVCDMYAAPDEAIRTDVMELMQELVAEDLLRLTEAP